MTTHQPAVDSLSDFTMDSRVLLLSAMALVIGAISALVAWVLLWLIAAITNLAFFQRFSTAHVTPEDAHPVWWSTPREGTRPTGRAAGEQKDTVMFQPSTNYQTCH